MCVNRLSWEASDGKKRVVLPSSTPDLEKKPLFFSTLRNLGNNALSPCKNYFIIEKAAAAFRGLIDLAIKSDGSYYLTYHKWAKKSQLESCYPQFNTFMEMKRSYDPSEVFQSDWYRHNRDLLNS